ncbi:hypothetical protein C0J52_13337 [Blattella germanica]|nr:hypothetical protein C0J52_13337 [Blattella germanica]
MHRITNESSITLEASAIGRSRSLTHLDCLDPNDLTPDVIMTTDTADRLIVPCTEPPRVRRQKLARSQPQDTLIKRLIRRHTLTRLSNAAVAIDEKCHPEV